MTSAEPTTSTPLPGENLDIDKMPGHWVLARVGKRVLRPGGVELTRKMLDALRIGPADHVVEFAPGLGLTTRLALASNPQTYTAVERDPSAAALVARLLTGPQRRVVQASAESSGLPDEVATVVFGEAMLSMQTSEQKRRIIGEAHRLLQPGGRYAIHEICLVPDDIAAETIEPIERDLTGAIHAGVRPLRTSEWRSLFDETGFDVVAEETTEFRLLEPTRVLRDEGLGGAARMLLNILRNARARRRVLAMRRAIRAHAPHMRAVVLLGTKR